MRSKSIMALLAVLLCTPLMLVSQEMKEKEQYFVGIGAEPHLDFISGVLQHSSGDMVIATPMHISSVNAGIGCTLTGDILFPTLRYAPLADSVFWGLSARLTLSGVSFKGTVEEPSRFVQIGGNLTPLREQNRIEWNASSMTLVLAGAVHKIIPQWDSARVYCSFGPVLSFCLNQDFHQYTDILAPETYNYTETGTKTRLLSQGEMPNVSSPRFGIEWTFGAKWDARRIFRDLQYPVSFGAEIGYRGYLTSLISEPKITGSQIILRLLFDYRL